MISAPHSLNCFSLLASSLRQSVVALDLLQPPSTQQSSTVAIPLFASSRVPVRYEHACANNRPVKEHQNDLGLLRKPSDLPLSLPECSNDFTMQTLPVSIDLRLRSTHGTAAAFAWLGAADP